MTALAEDQPLTLDSLQRGRLSLFQPQRGYRFNLDSVVLGAVALGYLGQGPVVDAGAGCGVVGLYLAAHGATQVLLVERQAQMARLAWRNVAHNRLQDRAAVLHADFRSMPLRDHSVALMVSNPPYLAPGGGRHSPRPQRALSIHSVHGGMPEVLSEAHRVLSPGGHLVVVGPGGSANYHSEMNMLRVIKLAPRADAQASRQVVVWSRNRCGETVTEHRDVHESGGGFSPWLRDVLEGRRASVEQPASAPAPTQDHAQQEPGRGGGRGA